MIYLNTYICYTNICVFNLKQIMRDIKEPIEDLRENLKTSRTLWLYGHQRFDLLIISISGGGIYLIINIFQYFSPYNVKSVVGEYTDFGMIKIAGGAFLLSIISNLLSQWASITVNYCHIRIRKLELLYKQNERNLTIIDLKEHKNMSEKANCYENINVYINISSIILMVTGLVLVAIYFLINF